MSVSKRRQSARLLAKREKKKYAASSSSGMVLVTVGSTFFDELMQVINTQEFAQVLSSIGTKKINIQYGRGKEREFLVLKKYALFEVKCFAFCDSLAEYMNQASLVISHAGAGTVMEALRAHRTLVVVTNSSLMDDHQSELASVMHERGHCISSSCKDVVDHLRTRFVTNTSFDPENDRIHALVTPLVPLPLPPKNLFAHLLDAEMGYTPFPQSLD